MSKEMSDEALDKVVRLLKSMTVGAVKGGKVVILAPVKISKAIAEEVAEEAKEKLDK